GTRLGGQEQGRVGGGQHSEGSQGLRNRRSGLELRSDVEVTMASRISRRALLALAGSAALAAAAGPAAAPAVPVRGIHVAATSDGATLQTLAQMVGEEFVALLGARYVRGARTGGTLVVTLTGVDLVDSTGAASGGRHRTFNGGNGGNDQLEGTVALLGPRRE